MTQRLWDPLKELEGVHRRLNQLFESALSRSDFDTHEGIGAWAPTADVHETGDSFVVELELPGLDQREIEIRVDGDELVVEGERRMRRGETNETFHRVERNYGKFSRRFRLPSTVDREHIEATYRNGVLDIVVAKTDRRGPEAIKVPIR
jgi:HSP20 family protein